MLRLEKRCHPVATQPAVRRSSYEEIELCHGKGLGRRHRGELAVQTPLVSLRIDRDLGRAVVAHHVGLAKVAAIANRLDLTIQPEPLADAGVEGCPRGEGYGRLSRRAAEPTYHRAVDNGLRGGAGALGSALYGPRHH